MSAGAWGTLVPVTGAYCLPSACTCRQLVLENARPCHLAWVVCQVSLLVFWPFVYLVAYLAYMVISLRSLRKLSWIQHRVSGQIVRLTVCLSLPHCLLVSLTAVMAIAPGSCHCQIMSLGACCCTHQAC